MSAGAAARGGKFVNRRPQDWKKTCAQTMRNAASQWRTCFTFDLVLDGLGTLHGALTDSAARTARRFPIQAAARLALFEYIEGGTTRIVATSVSTTNHSTTSAANCRCSDRESPNPSTEPGHTLADRCNRLQIVYGPPSLETEGEILRATGGSNAAACARSEDGMHHDGIDTLAPA